LVVVLITTAILDVFEVFQIILELLWDLGKAAVVKFVLYFSLTHSHIGLNFFHFTGPAKLASRLPNVEHVKIWLR